MLNPSFSSSDSGQVVGVSPSNPINDPGFTSRQGSNTFDLSYQNLLTCRYGEITPFFYMSALGRDRIELRSAHELRTYTLGSPLMSGLRMRKSTFSVSKKSMMPYSWNYLFVNPVKGHDVPDDAYCSFDVCKFLDAIFSAGVRVTDRSKLLKLFVLLCQVGSAGSVLDNLGISIYPLINAAANFTKDESAVDRVCDTLLHALVSDLTFSVTYSLFDPATGESNETVLNNDGTVSSVFEMFQMIAQHPDCTIVVDSAKLDSLVSWFMEVNDNLYFRSNSLVINLYKVIAYQMICSQFYSNDHVDNVYNSDLWLSNQKSLAYKAAGNSLSFSYNGVPVYYDVYSRHMLDKLVAVLNDVSSVNFDSVLYFFFNTFTYRRSLRYGDYFLSSRPMPLAVGDVSVPVVGAGVNVIDINKNLHIQRFLNAVNRVGSDIVNYAKGIFGYTPTEDDARPRFISSEVVYVGSDEVDNTADDQGTINVNMIAQNTNNMFDLQITDECVILGLLSFECTGSYSRSIERDNFHVSRFDSFIPELQHIGDQEVYRAERVGVPTAAPFGYQVRYAEYKFKFNQMHGAFCTSALKSWAFPVNVFDSPILDEDSIRSTTKELDSYYKSLTYASLASRFHFQISFANNVRANRAMDYQPTLL